MKSNKLLLLLILFCSCSTRSYYVNPTYFTSVELKLEKNNTYNFRFLDENNLVISYGNYTEIENKIHFNSSKRDSNCNVELTLSDSSFSKKRIYFSTLITTYFRNIKFNEIAFNEYEIKGGNIEGYNFRFIEFDDDIVSLKITGDYFPFYIGDKIKFEFKAYFQNHNCAILSFPENYFNRKDPNNSCYYDFITLNPFVFTKKGRTIIMDSALFNLPAESRKNYILKRKNMVFK